jgi:hypothetical protein
VNLLREKQKCLGYMPMGGGGGSSADATNQTTTTNVDRRAVLDHSAFVGDGSTSTVNMYTTQADAEVLNTLAANIPDAMAALSQAGATIIRDSGGAVVDLNRDSIAANTKAWDSTLQFGAATVDKAIDVLSASFGTAAKNVEASNALASKVVDSFTPTENKNADIGKYAMWAAAAVAAAVLLKGSK